MLSLYYLTRMIYSCFKPVLYYQIHLYKWILIFISSRFFINTFFILYLYCLINVDNFLSAYLVKLKAIWFKENKLEHHFFPHDRIGGKHALPSPHTFLYSFTRFIYLVDWKGETLHLQKRTNEEDTSFTAGYGDTMDHRELRVESCGTLTIASQRCRPVLSCGHKQVPLIDQHTQSLTRSLRDSKSMGTLQKLHQPTGHLGFNFIYRIDGIQFFFSFWKRTNNWHARTHFWCCFFHVSTAMQSQEKVTGVHMGTKMMCPLFLTRHDKKHPFSY